MIKVRNNCDCKKKKKKKKKTCISLLIKVNNIYIY